MSERTVAIRFTASMADYKRSLQDGADATNRLGTSVTGARKQLDGMDGSTRQAAGGMTSVAGSAKAMGAAVGLGAAAAGLALVSFARDGVRAASQLEEQMAATKTIFGDAADEMIAFGESAEVLGISTKDALQAGNAFGDLFTKIGFTTDAAQTFSEDLVRMSADFASFKDMDPAAVLEKLRAGLAGESEPLRQLGVFLTEAKVKAEGMSLGLANASGELDEGAKVAARYSLIMKEMGQAQGDVARTADSYANTQRRAAAEAENLKASIGAGLLPVLTDLLTITNKVTGAMDDFMGSGDGGSWIDGVPILNNIVMALDKLAGESEVAADATDYLSDSQAALADSQSRTKRNVELTTKQLEEQRDALDELLQATQAQFSSEVAYQRAVLGLAGDLEDYNASLAANADGKKDNDVAATELAEQELGLRDALLATGEAAVQQATDQAAAAGKTLSESQKYDVFRAALVQLKEQFPALSGVIDGYIARLDAVPPDVRTNAELTGVELAKARAQQLRDTLSQIPSFKSVTVQYNEVLGSQVQRGAFAGRVIERATGGAVFGPGTGTSDSIAAWLSNGEHVWTAAEVAKAGGHKAVERLRKTVLGFKTGGRVGSLALAGGGAVDQYEALALAGARS